MLRNQRVYLAGMLVLSLLVGGQVFAQDRSGSCGTPVECYEQSLENLMKERQSLQEAREEMDKKMADLQAAMTQKIRDLQSANSAMEVQIEALKKEAGEVRVQTGRVHITRDAMPELLQPNCRSHVERGEKHGRVDFQEPFASTPKVIMALAGIDMFHEAHGRFHVIVESVGAKGFEYRFVTWCDTRLYWAEAYWIAVAQ